MKEIVLAGGCFWGVEAYFKELYGVISCESGYANGEGTPDYKGLVAGYFDHAEAVRVVYDEEKTSLYMLVAHFFRVVDPTSLNRQAMDIGTQYRSGIYYSSEEEGQAIRDLVELYRQDYKKPIVVEVQPLENFHRAEDYHQNYLGKNPQGYCHIPRGLAGDLFIPKYIYELIDPGNLDQMPQENKKGIYVSSQGLPIYLSRQRIESGFSGQPLVEDFDGKLYFIKEEDMQAKGYGYLLGHL